MAVDRRRTVKLTDIDAAPSRAEQVTGVVGMSIAIVGAVILGSAFLVPIPLAVGLVGLAAAVISTVIITALVYRAARRGGRGAMRSVGRAAWEGLKFLFTFP